MRHLFSIVMLVALLPLASFSKGRVVTGVVRNSAGEPLDLVDVAEGRFQVGTYCDARGHFMLEIPSDTVREADLQFSLVGYEDHSEVVRLVGDTTTIRIVLNDKSDEIGQVDVVAQGKQETTVENLKVEVTKTMPSASGDGIVGVVTAQPGVSSNNELSSQYSVRGGNYDENCVYVNSIEVYRPLLIRSGEQEGLSFVNQDLVESVSFSSGGFSPEYGDKMSSVLDIKYKKPTAFEGSASISFLGASAYIGSSSKRFSQMHGFRYKTSSYLLNTLETKGEYNPKFLDYQTYMTYVFSPKWDLSFLGNISRNKYNFIPASRSTNFGTMTDMHNVNFDFYGQEMDLFSTYFGALTLSCKPSSSLNLDFIGSTFRSVERVGYDITSVYSMAQVEMGGSYGRDEGGGAFHQHSRDRFAGTVTNISHIGTLDLKKNTLKWGLSWQLEDMSEEVNEWEYRDSAGYSLPIDPNRMSLYDNLSADVGKVSHRLSGFVQDSYSWRTAAGRYVLLGGVRFSYWDFNEQLICSPRGSFAWFPAHSSWAFRVATGIYHQALMFKEMKKVVEEDGNRVIYLNRDVKPPRSSQIILSSDYYFKKWGRPFKLTGELYYKYMDRIIPYKVDNMQITYRGENCADGFAFGGDVKLFGEFVPGTDSWISFSMMNTRENIYGDQYGYVPRPTDQRYNISLFFQDYLPGYERLKFNIKLVWADGYPFRSPYSSSYNDKYRMADYRRLDIGAVYQLQKGVDAIMEKKVFAWMKTISFNLDVFNVLGISNVNSYYWVPVQDGCQYAVPNYLTGRLFNLRLAIGF